VPDQRHTWRVLLCDIQGNPLSNLSTLATGRKWSGVLNQPTTFSFTVDPDHPKIRTLHTDGAPYLDYIRRMIKAYRYEPIQTGGWAYVLRFAGYVWPIQDVGDENGQTSQVTAIDPLIMLSKRLARTAAGAYQKVAFSAIDGGQILKTVVDRTNDLVIGGGPTGLITAGGTFETIATASVSWDYKLLSVAAAELTKGFDLSVTPKDSTTQQHGILNAWAHRGVDRQDALFSWKTLPHTLARVSRTMDPADAATTLVGLGSTASGTQLLAAATDTAARDNYMHMEALTSYSDVKDQAHLNTLIAQDLVDRRPPQEAISVTPFDGLEPWLNFDVGDFVYTSADPALRGGILKRQERLYGMTVDINDEDDESVEAVTQAPS
jgi:hypothetical protein